MTCDIQWTTWHDMRFTVKKEIYSKGVRRISLRITTHVAVMLSPSVTSSIYDTHKMATTCANFYFTYYVLTRGEHKNLRSFRRKLFDWPPEIALYTFLELWQYPSWMQWYSTWILPLIHVPRLAYSEGSLALSPLQEISFCLLLNCQLLLSGLSSVEISSEEVFNELPIAWTLPEQVAAASWVCLCSYCVVAV